MTLRNCLRLALSAALCLAFNQTALAVSKARDFTLPTDSGKVELSQFKGKVVYLDFWASWCPPRRKSFPWLNEMQKRYGEQGFAVIAVNLDKTHDLADRFLSKYPAEFTVAYDPDGRVAEQYHVQGMPSSFFIDRKGRIREIHMGFRTEDTSQLEDTLQSLLVQ